MKVTQTHLNSFHHAKEFFLKYPNILSEAEEVLRVQGMKQSIIDGANAVQKEIDEHSASKADVQNSKSKLKELKRAVQIESHWLADIFQTILEAEGETEIFFWDLDKKNEIESLESLLKSIKKFPELIESNATLQKKLSQFENNLVQYKATLQEHGDATVQEMKESEEREAALVQHYPIISASLYFVYHYLRLTNPVIFEEWKQIKSSKSTKTSSESSETPAFTLTSSSTEVLSLSPNQTKSVQFELSSNIKTTTAVLLAQLSLESANELVSIANTPSDTSAWSVQQKDDTHFVLTIPFQSTSKSFETGNTFVLKANNKELVSFLVKITAF